mmetsp:Transcript_17970/g.44006  ORF Transcript_17970/g.44006 Transcript_17970/m.44006 type:complete len:1467 (-) Transcript_17970:209-4609(-)
MPRRRRAHSSSRVPSRREGGGRARALARGGRGEGGGGAGRGGEGGRVAGREGVGRRGGGGKGARGLVAAGVHLAGAGDHRLVFNAEPLKEAVGGVWVRLLCDLEDLLAEPFGLVPQPVRILEDLLQLPGDHRARRGAADAPRRLALLPDLVAAQVEARDQVAGHLRQLQQAPRLPGHSEGVRLDLVLDGLQGREGHRRHVAERLHGRGDRVQLRVDLRDLPLERGGEGVPLEPRGQLAQPREGGALVRGPELRARGQQRGDGFVRGLGRAQGLLHLRLEAGEPVRVGDEPPDVGQLADVRRLVADADRLSGLEAKMQEALRSAEPSDEAVTALLAACAQLRTPHKGPTLPRLRELSTRLKGNALASTLQRKIAEINAELYAVTTSVKSLGDVSSMAFTSLKTIKNQIQSDSLTVSGEARSLLELAEVTRDLVSGLHLSCNKIRKESQAARRIGSTTAGSVVSRELQKVLEDADRLRNEAEGLGEQIFQIAQEADPNAPNGLFEWLCIEYEPMISSARKVNAGSDEPSGSFSSAAATPDPLAPGNAAAFSSSPGSSAAFSATATRKRSGASSSFSTGRDSGGGMGASSSGHRRHRRHLDEAENLPPGFHFESPYQDRLDRVQDALDRANCFEDGSSDPTLFLRTFILRKISCIRDLSHLIRVAVSASSEGHLPAPQQISMLEEVLKLMHDSKSEKARKGSLEASAPNELLINRVLYQLLQNEDGRLRQEAVEAAILAKPKTAKEMFPSERRFGYEICTKESLRLRALARARSGGDRPKKQLKPRSMGGMMRRFSASMSNLHSSDNEASKTRHRMSSLEELPEETDLKASKVFTSTRMASSLSDIKTQEEEIYSSKLWKRGENNQKYKERVFKLVKEKNDFLLKYYEQVSKGDKTKEKHKGTVLLSTKGVSVEVGSVVSGTAEKEFVVHTPSRLYHLKAATEDLADSWCQEINAVLDIFDPKSFIKAKQRLESIDDMLKFVRGVDGPAGFQSSSSFSPLTPRPDKKAPPPAEFGFSAERVVYRKTRRLLEEVTNQKLIGSRAVYAPFDVVDSPSTILLDDGGKIRAATLAKCIQRVTEDGIDEKMVDMVLTNYNLSATPLELLVLLMRRFCVPPTCNVSPEESETSASKQGTIRMSVLIFINIWIRKYCVDFQNDDQLNSTVIRYLELIKNSKLNGEEEEVASLSLNLLKSPAPETTHLHTVEDLKKAGEESSKEKKFDKVKATVFAEQLTLRHFAIYQSITPREFLKTGWSKPDKKERSPFIVEMTEHYNSLARFVQRTILSATELRKRAQVMTKWLEIGDCCFEHQSYHAVGAIYAGLSSDAVYRLWKTKELLGKKAKLFDKLKQIIKRDGNSKDYRTLLENSFSSCVPYLPTFCGDLEKTETANESSILGMINFYKHQTRMDIIIKVLRFQQQELHYAKIEVDGDVQHLLTEALVTDIDKAAVKKFEDEMWAASNTVEPKETVQE